MEGGTVTVTRRRPTGHASGAYRSACRAKTSNRSGRSCRRHQVVHDRGKVLFDDGRTRLHLRTDYSSMEIRDKRSLRNDSLLAQAVQRQLYSRKISGVPAADRRRVRNACAVSAVGDACFFPKPLIDRMARGRRGTDSATGGQSRNIARNRMRRFPRSSRFRTKRRIRCSCRWTSGWCAMPRQLQPKLVELQAFPSLYAYQGPLAEAYIDVYGLDGSRLSASGSGRLKYFLSGLETDFLPRTSAPRDCRIA